MTNLPYKKTQNVIWTIRVKLSQVRSECVRVIEIESCASLLELHEIIQDSVGFINDHLFDFFVGKHSGNRAYSIGPEQNWDTVNPVKAYRNVYLSDVWPLPIGMKQFYLFDFGDNWLFQIAKTRHKDKIAQPGVLYPRVIEVKGKNPEQYTMWED